MKSSKITYLILFTFFFAFFTVSNAQIKTKKVTKRQIVQEKKIAQGIKSGELTRVEVKQLEKQQSKILKAKKIAKSDGVVTKREIIKIDKMQDNARKNIYKKKHNKRDRS